MSFPDVFERLEGLTRSDHWRPNFNQQVYSSTCCIPSLCLRFAQHCPTITQNSVQCQEGRGLILQQKGSEARWNSSLPPTPLHLWVLALVPYTTYMQP